MRERERERVFFTPEISSTVTRWCVVPVGSADDEAKTRAHDPEEAEAAAGSRPRLEAAAM